MKRIRPHCLAALMITVAFSGGCGSPEGGQFTNSNASGQSQTQAGSIVLRTQLEAPKPKASSSTVIASEVQNFRFTGLSADGAVAYGPASLAKAPEVRLDAIPLEVVKLQVELLDREGLPVGGLSVPVQMNPGQPVVLTSPRFAYLGSDLNSAESADVYGSFYFNNNQTASPVDYDQTATARGVLRTGAGLYRIGSTGDYLVRTSLTVGRGQDESLRLETDRGALRNAPFQVQAAIAGEVTRSFSTIASLRAGDTLQLVRVRQTSTPFLAGNLNLTLIGQEKPGVQLESQENTPGEEFTVLPHSLSHSGQFLVYPGRTGSPIEVQLRNRQTGATRNLATGGLTPTISSDGNFAAFSVQESSAIVSYRKDLITDRIEKVSDLVGSSSLPVLSASGSKVLFTNEANNSANEYIHDFQSGLTQQINYDQNGSIVNSLVTRPGEHDISGDGRFVTFSGYFVDDWYIFIRDLSNSSSRRLSVGQYSCLSFDGGKVAFIRDNDNGQLVYLDLVDDTAKILDSNARSSCSMSDAGRYVVFINTSDRAVVVDALTGVEREISFTSDGEPTTDLGVGISGDGKTLTWSTDGAVVPEDTNGLTDVYTMPNPLAP